MSWFKEWFDEYYLDLYRSRDPCDAEEQSKLIIKTLKDCGGEPQTKDWIDIGCGMGRYVNIFYEKGFCIRGIDISHTLIVEGKKIYPHIDISHKTISECLNESQRYGILLSLFTSFGYYEKDEDNFLMLQNMVALGNVSSGKSSSSRTYLWFDFLNAKKLLSVALKDDLIKSPKGNMYIQERRIVTNADEGSVSKYIGSRIEKTIKVYNSAGDYLKTYQESVRLFTLTDFEDMFKKVGMEIIFVFGDYQGNPYTITSPRLIMLAQRDL